MVWVKIDEELPFHPKVVRAGPLALALHVCALCWCNQYLTDGFVPVAIVDQLVNFKGVAEPVGGVPGQFEAMRDVTNIALAIRLEECGMWEAVEGGWLIHDFLDYQPSKEEVLALREERADAGRRGGLAKAKQTPSKPIANEVAKTCPVPVPVPVPLLIQQQQPASEVAPTSPEGKQDIGGPETAQLYDLLNRSGVIVGSTMQAQQWDGLLDITHDMGVITEAFTETAKQGKQPSPAYIRRILERCVRDGVRPGTWAGGKPGARASPRQSGVLDDDAVLAMMAEQARQKEGGP